MQRPSEYRKIYFANLNRNNLEILLKRSDIKNLTGFLNAGVKSARGNQALKDIVLSLKWIQKNIEAFSGDKNRSDLEYVKCAY